MDPFKIRIVMLQFVLFAQIIPFNSRNADAIDREYAAIRQAFAGYARRGYDDRDRKSVV